MNNATTHLRGLIAAIILGLVASGSAAAGASANHPDTVSTTVRYEDLNIVRTKDAGTLYNRIVAAAHELCDTYASLSPKAGKQAQACVQGAVVDAVMKVNRPQVFAIYNARNPDPLPVTLASRANR